MAVYVGRGVFFLSVLASGSLLGHHLGSAHPIVILMTNTANSVISKSCLLLLTGILTLTVPVRADFDCHAHTVSLVRRSYTIFE